MFQTTVSLLCNAILNAFVTKLKSKEIHKALRFILKPLRDDVTVQDEKWSKSSLMNLIKLLVFIYPNVVLCVSCSDLLNDPNSISGVVIPPAR